MYYWRKLTESQRDAALQYRRIQKLPKHCPPHFDFEGERQYLLTGACYEHSQIIGKDSDRMSAFEATLLDVCQQLCPDIYAWCILPNHYHLLLITGEMTELRRQIGLLNGRTSFTWNGEDDTRGRKVWHNCFEWAIRSQRHYFATLNYVLNNPVHHGYAKSWQDWPWSNAKEYLESVGRECAAETWKEYPVMDMGKSWDIY